MLNKILRWKLRFFNPTRKTRKVKAKKSLKKTQILQEEKPQPLDKTGIIYLFHLPSYDIVVKCQNDPFLVSNLLLISLCRVNRHVFWLCKIICSFKWFFFIKARRSILVLDYCEVDLFSELRLLIYSIFFKLIVLVSIQDWKASSVRYPIQ